MKKLTGYVKNGQTGAAIAGATIKILAGPSAGMSVQTNSAGHYSAMLGAGNGLSTIEVNVPGYERNVETMSIGAQSRFDVDLCRTLSPGELRVISSWGAHPRDLDIWMQTPNGCTIGYNNKKCLGAQNVALDIDKTSGYGPETISMHKPMPGVYKFYVHKYSGLGNLDASNNVVKVFEKKNYPPYKTLLHTFKVGQQGRTVGGRFQWTQANVGGGRYWNVFAFDSRSGLFAPAPHIPPSSNTTACAFCV